MDLLDKLIKMIYWTEIDNEWNKIYLGRDFQNNYFENLQKFQSNLED